MGRRSYHAATMHHSCAFLLCSVPLAAQVAGVVTADLEGRVLHQGRPVAGARLGLRHESSGRRWQTTTDDQGFFRLRFLPTGPCHLMAEDQAGHRATWDLQLDVGTLHRLTLSLGAPAMVVPVEAPAVEGIRTQRTATITPEALQALPVSRRSYFDLSLTTPLAVPGRGPITGGAPDSRLSLGGASPRQNQFLLDGLDNGDLGTGSPRMPISQEAIQSFQILAGGYSAEFGRAGGGVLNAVTRSGGNTAEGSLFWFVRPGTWDARPSTGHGTRDMRLHQVGASAGGPIRKDKLFWFVAVERLDQRDRFDVAIRPEVATLLGSQGFPVPLGLLPARELATSAFLKLDGQLTADHTFAGSVVHSWEDNESQIPWGGLAARSTGGHRTTEALSVSLTHRWLASSTVVNEARAQYTTRDNDLTSLETREPLALELQGTAVLGSQRLAPQRTRATYFQLVDQLTVALGTHTVKAGGEWMETHNRGQVGDAQQGYYLFTALPALGLETAAAAFAAPNPFGGQGLPALFLQRFGDADIRFRTRLTALYVQDEWIPSPAWLVRVGLRFDQNHLPLFLDTPAYQALTHLSVRGYPTRLPDGAIRYGQLFTPSLNWSSAHLSPRVGFSWTLSPSWRLFGAGGRFIGAVNLGPVLGVRAQNGREVVSVLRTVLDPPLQGPWISWASADGLAVQRRYASPPPGNRLLVLPGTLGAPSTRQGNLALAWKALPTLEWTLEGTVAHTRGLMNLRDVNAFVPIGTEVRRPDLRYAGIYRSDGSGESRFRALVLDVQWLPASAWETRASLTWSHAEDNYVDWTGALAPQNTFDPAQEWGPSYQHQRLRCLGNLLWHSPNRAWRIAALVQWASGRPYTVLLGSDRNLNGDPGSDRPEGLGRNSATLPWTRTLDLRVSRTWALGRTRIEGLLDVFNALNAANVLEVQNSLGSTQPPFGTPILQDRMRQLQVGVRLSY